MQNTTNLRPLGTHLLAEFYGCNSNILNNVEVIDTAMTEAAIRSGATIVQKDFHHFSPYGVSGVVIIAESHLAIHTWPEYEYAAIDLFTCGETVDPYIAYEYLKEQFHAQSAAFSELKRGLLDPESNQLQRVPFLVHTTDQQPSVAKT